MPNTAISDDDPQRVAKIQLRRLRRVVRRNAELQAMVRECAVDRNPSWRLEQIEAKAVELAEALAAAVDFSEPEE
jgi:hypothetical protein